MYKFARAIKTKYQRLGGLSNRSLFALNSEAWKSEILVSAREVSSEVSLLALQMAAFLRLHMVLPLCALCPFSFLKLVILD